MVNECQDSKDNILCPTSFTMFDLVNHDKFIKPIKFRSTYYTMVSLTKIGQYSKIKKPWLT